MIFFGCHEILSEVSTIEIETDSFCYDLHNAGTFLGFDYDVKSKMLKLNWKLIDAEKNLEVFCQILLKNIYYFSVGERDPESPFSEDDCLSEIIYNKKINEILFKFMGGQKIRVNCDEFHFIATHQSAQTKYL